MLTPTPAPRPMTERQRLVLTLVVNYYTATGEPCTLAYLARRLSLDRKTVQGHLRALVRKGCLPAPAAPRTALD